MMFFKFAFKHFSDERKSKEIRENGVLLGAREVRGRKFFLFMVKDFFAEVCYAGDDLDGKAEKIELFPNIKRLNAYLEQDCRAAL